MMRDEKLNAGHIVWVRGKAFTAEYVARAMILKDDVIEALSQQTRELAEEVQRLQDIEEKYNDLVGATPTEEQLLSLVSLSPADQRPE